MSENKRLGNRRRRKRNLQQLEKQVTQSLGFPLNPALSTSKQSESNNEQLASAASTQDSEPFYDLGLVKKEVETDPEDPSNCSLLIRDRDSDELHPFQQVFVKQEEIVENSNKKVLKPCDTEQRVSQEDVYNIYEDIEFSVDSIKTEAELCLQNCGLEECGRKDIKQENNDTGTILQVKVIHPSKLCDFNDKMNKRGQKRNNDITDPDQQPAMKSVKQTHLGDNIPKSTDEQNKAVLRFVVGTGSPFSIVEHEDFLNLIKTNGGKNPPNRKQLMEQLEKSFKQMKDELITSLSEVSTVCATADCWTVFRRSYIGMTVHWLDPLTLERRSSGIACRRIQGRHTYDVIADAIESILDDFEIKSKCSMMITDNGSNFLKAFRLFGGSGQTPDLGCEDSEEIDEGDIVPEAVTIAPILEDSDDYGRLPPHHSCAAHTLNLLATTDAEAAKCDNAYKRIERMAFAKCQAIFSKQKKSALAADIVKKHLGRYFLVPEATRWTSHFDAIELLIQKEDKLDRLCKDLDLPTFKRPQEIEFLVEYCKVMEPIALGLDILRGEKEIYMGYLLPTLTVVKSALTSLSELQWCEPLKQALLKGFDKRFSKYFENPDLEIGACLVPRFKLDWVPQEVAERQSLRDTLSAEFLKAAKKQPSTITTAAGIKPPSNSKIDRFFSVITPKISNNDSLQIERAKAESELARYLNDTVDVKDMSDFCKQLFIKYNTAVPSSALCERLFSSASLVITNRRGRITDSNFEMQLLLKFNKYLK